MRLIDVDEIKLPQGFFEKIDNVPKFYEWLGTLPTVSQHVESVGEDGSALKHGHWIDGNGNPVSWDDMNIGCPSDSCYCSECGDWLTASDEYPAKGYYCPNCGAKMDEVEE